MRYLILLIGLALIFVAGCTAESITGDAVCDLDGECPFASEGTDNAASGTQATQNDGYIEIPLSEVSDQVKFYDLNAGNIKIRYFTVLGSDGLPRTAFDACDVCGGYKGYRQEGSDIVCNNCGRVFAIDGLGEENRGYGCWPSYLPHEVKNGKILIKVDDILAGKQKFA